MAKNCQNDPRWPSDPRNDFIWIAKKYWTKHSFSILKFIILVKIERKNDFNGKMLLIVYRTQWKRLSRTIGHSRPPSLFIIHSFRSYLLKRQRWKTIFIKWLVTVQTLSMGPRSIFKRKGLKQLHFVVGCHFSLVFIKKVFLFPF